MYLWLFTFFKLYSIYLICRVKVGFKKIFASQFQTYLLLIFIILVLQMLYSTYHKLSEGIGVFKMKPNNNNNNNNKINLFSCVNVKKFHFKMRF